MDNSNNYEWAGRRNQDIEAICNILHGIENTPDQPLHSQPINDLDGRFNSATSNAAPTTFHKTGTNAAPNTALDMAADFPGDGVPLSHSYYHRASRTKRSKVSKKRVPKSNHVQNNLTSSQKDEQDKKLEEIKKCLGEMDKIQLRNLFDVTENGECADLITEAWHEKRMAELEAFKVHVESTEVAPF